jgi:hypothetical protein
MRARGAVAFSWLVLGEGLGACHSSRRPTHSPPEADAWYDAQPLLVALRPEARADAAAAAGVRRLEDLPLYDLDVSIDATAKTFTVREDLWLTNTGSSPLAEVVLRVYADALPAKSGSAPPVRLVSGSCVIGGPCLVEPDGPSAISVRPTAPMAPGGRLRVSLALAGVLDTIDSSRTNLLAQGLEGLPGLVGGAETAGDYGLLAVGDGIATFANFYPVLARRGADGAWQRSDTSTIGDLGPDDLSNVRARIELPASAKLATTGVTVAEEAAGPSRRVVRVAAAMVRDFAMLASDAFAMKAARVGDVDVRSFYLASERGAGERALDVAVHALADYERRFGPYAYADFDVVESAIVGGAGGVEFSGLATAASMLYRPFDAGSLGLLSLVGGVPGAGGLGRSATADGMGEKIEEMTGSMLEFCVAHEVAHQWWHGMVGSDSREHPFVDEGLAQYSALLYLEDRYGKERARRDGDTNVKTSYQMMRLLGTPDAPVDQPVAAFASPLAYAGLVYGKGPYFYEAVRKALGDAQFFAVLEAYTAKNRFRQAPGRGLVEGLATGPKGPEVRALASRWLDEAHGDEDLGELDLGGVVRDMLGGAGGAGGEETEALLGLLGSGRGVGGGDAGKGKKSNGDELQELLRGMGLEKGGE